MFTFEKQNTNIFKNSITSNKLALRRITVKLYNEITIILWRKFCRRRMIRKNIYSDILVIIK